MKDRNLFKAFDLDPDRIFFTPEMQTAALDIRRLATSRKMAAVVGPFGSGKTVLWRAATIGFIDSMESRPIVVFVPQPDKGRLSIGQILAAMIHDLSEENPRSSLLARTYQAARIVGEIVHVEQREICVVVENAHRIKAGLLLDIKDMMESLRYRGEDHLFSVLLVGQAGLRSKMDIYGEVRCRMSSVIIQPLTYDQRLLYIGNIYGDVIDLGVKKQIASLFATPLEIDHFLEGRLLMLQRAGLRRLSDAFPITLTEQMAALDVSAEQVARNANLKAASVYRALSDTATPDDVAKIQTALDGLNPNMPAVRAA